MKKIDLTEKNSIRQKEVCKKYDSAKKMNEANIHTGMVDKIWVKKDNESKVISKNELSDYLSKGWIEGRILEGHPATENQKLKLSERKKIPMNNVLTTTSNKLTGFKFEFFDKYLK